LKSLLLTDGPICCHFSHYAKTEDIELKSSI
jgi:hypothetical protein